MVKQQSLLVNQVIRTISALNDPKGALIPSIINGVKVNLKETDHEIPRNLTMQIKRALKHAVNQGLLLLRAGRYRVATKKRVVPVDSLELAMDRARSNRSRRRRSRRRRHNSEHDFKTARGSRTRRRRRQRKQSRERSDESQAKSITPKAAASTEKQRQATPTASSNNTAATQNSTSDVKNQEQEHYETSIPDSDSVDTVCRRNNRRRRRVRRGQRNSQRSDGPPAVEDDPMERGGGGSVENSRHATPRKVSIPPRQENDNDMMDKIDKPPSYYN